MTKKWGLKEWVDNWKKISPLLQAQRDLDIRNSNTPQAIDQLDWSSRYARSNFPASQSSGLVEFYRVLLKGAR